MLVLVHLIPELDLHPGKHAYVHFSGLVCSANLGVPDNDPILDLQENGSDDQPDRLEL